MGAKEVGEGAARSMSVTSRRAACAASRHFHVDDVVLAQVDLGRRARPSITTTSWSARRSCSVRSTMGQSLRLRPRQGAWLIS